MPEVSAADVHRRRAAVVRLIRKLIGLPVLAIILAVPAIAQPTDRQTQLLVNNCVQCHARPETGAPVMGVPGDWQASVARGEDAMLRNVVLGIRGMPPLGYCSACTEQDFRALIRLMAGLSEDEGGTP